MANLLQKQGFYNSIILYVGTALGFFNLAILFQRYLSIEEIGFFSLMIALSLLYAQIASLGINNITIKFFPHYRSEDKTHAGFITFIILWCLAGFAALTMFFVLFKDSVIAHYSGQKGAALLVKYYYYLIPVSFLTIALSVLENIGVTVFKNVLSAFLREIVFRFATTVSIILIAASFIDYHWFLIIYICTNVTAVIILCHHIFKDNDFKLVLPAERLKKDYLKLLKYGAFTLLSNSSFVLIQNLDIIMLTGITKDLKQVGIYSTFFAVAVIISLPSKALNRTSLQIIAQSWAVNDLEKINKIYYKTSIVQMFIGCLFFIGLIINHSLIIFLLHKPEYSGYFKVFIIVGLAFLADVTGGVNGYILNMSNYYKWTTYIIVSAVILCAVTNWFLIPDIGIMGAAIAYLLSMSFLNFAYWLFLKIKFNLQPFAKSHLLIVMISLVSFCAGWFMPSAPNIWINAIIRSGVVTLVYLSLAYFFKISEDINMIADKFIKPNKS